MPVKAREEGGGYEASEPKALVFPLSIQVSFCLQEVVGGPCRVMLLFGEATAQFFLRLRAIIGSVLLRVGRLAA